MASLLEKPVLPNDPAAGTNSKMQDEQKDFTHVCVHRCVYAYVRKIMSLKV